MKIFPVSVLPLFIGLSFFQAAQAAPDPASSTPFYAGFGITNSMPDDDGNYRASGGFQIYAGYELPYYILDMFDVSVEVGYHDSGDYEGKPQISGTTIVTPDDYNSAGFWTAAVLGYSLNQKTGLKGMLGYDAGDEDGVIFGAGAYYVYSKKVSLNVDYVVRDLSDSVQLNISYYY